MIHAKYTVVLKTLLDNAETKALIDKAMSTYPMYNPSNPMTYSLIPTREELNTKILNHYKYREIGFETVGRFIDELETSLNEIMPYYYQLFKSKDIMNGIDDVFGNVDIVESYEEESSGNMKSNTATTNTSNSETEVNTESHDASSSNSVMNDYSKHVKSDTPQDELNITANNIDSVGYASEVNWNKNENEGDTETSGSTDSSSTSKVKDENETSGNSEQETTGTLSHTLKRKGNQGVNTYAHDMKELRETFINIERMIINDDRIKELFMLVY